MCTNWSFVMASSCRSVTPGPEKFGRTTWEVQTISYRPAATLHHTNSCSKFPVLELLIKEMWNMKKMISLMFQLRSKRVYVMLKCWKATSASFVCLSAMLTTVIFVWTNKLIIFLWFEYMSMVHYACRKLEHICYIPNWVFKLSVQSGKKRVVIWNMVLYCSPCSRPSKTKRKDNSYPFTTPQDIYYAKFIIAFQINLYK